MALSLLHRHGYTCLVSSSVLQICDSPGERRRHAGKKSKQQASKDKAKALKTLEGERKEKKQDTKH